MQRDTTLLLLKAAYQSGSLSPCCSVRTTCILLFPQLRGRNLVPFTFDKQVLLLETMFAIWRCGYELQDSAGRFSRPALCSLANLCGCLPFQCSPRHSLMNAKSLLQCAYTLSRRCCVRSAPPRCGVTATAPLIQGFTPLAGRTWCRWRC